MSEIEVPEEQSHGPKKTEDMFGPGDPDDLMPGSVDLFDDPDETEDDDDVLEDEV